MDDRNSEQIIQAILDDETSGWSEAERKEKLSGSLAHLDLLAQAFRGSRVPAERDVQFHWRHLEVVEKIGEGGFGEVFRAYDPVLRRDVALKLDRAEPAMRPDRALVIAEARRMARVRHPNILAVHGADEKEGSVGIWFDLLEGSTLRQVLHDGPMDQAALLELAQPLADAVAEIHQHGLTHGDIKPGNVMVLNDGTPILMDFGAASDTGLLNLDQTGTPLVMAPEQFHGAATAPAADVYSLGVVLYHALSGDYPINGESIDDLVQQHDHGPGPGYAAIPRRWRPLLRQMLATQPENRPTARQVGERLERMRTARRRLIQRVSLAAVVVSLAGGIIAVGLAYQSAVQSGQRVEAVKDVVVEAMQSALPDRSSGPAAVDKVYNTLETLIEERLVDFPAALAEMRLVVAEGHAQLGDDKRGLEVAEKAWALLNEVRADSPRDMMAGAATLATLRARNADPVGAEQAARLMLEFANQLGRQGEQYAGVAADHRLQARNRLANSLGDQGRWYEAIAATQALLEDRAAYYGDDSVRVAVDHHNLAYYQLAAGYAAESAMSERRAAELLNLHGYGESTRMGYVQAGLADALMVGGELDEAETTLARARQLFAASLKPDHPRFNTLDSQLAEIIARRGQLSEAVSRYKEIATRENVGPGLTHDLQRKLANAYLEIGEWELAHQHMTRFSDNLKQEYRPLRPYVDAALAYSAYHAAKSRSRPADSPEPAIREALQQMRAGGYEQMEVFRTLQSWLEQLVETVTG